MRSSLRSVSSSLTHVAHTWCGRSTVSHLLQRLCDSTSAGVLFTWPRMRLRECLCAQTRKARTECEQRRQGHAKGVACARATAAAAQRSAARAAQIVPSRHAQASTRVRTHKRTQANARSAATAAHDARSRKQERSSARERREAAARRSAAALARRALSHVVRRLGTAQSTGEAWKARACTRAGIARNTALAFIAGRS